MIQSIVHIAIVVRDYDEAIDFYTKKLHFELVEDTYQAEQDKRWVVVSPPGSNGTTILLARASKPVQEPFIGNQAGGRVFMFLGTDDFWRDYREMKENGIEVQELLLLLSLLEMIKRVKLKHLNQERMILLKNHLILIFYLQELKQD